MSDNREQTRRYQQSIPAIREILLHDWDPIGVRDIPEAQDEYDSYIPGIYGRLIHRTPERQLFDHLRQIEIQQMGLAGDRSRTQDAVKKLLSLNTQLESTPIT